MAASLDVLFVAAAGPGRGFGHLVRAGILADALGVRRRIVLRASRATVQVARRFGWQVCAKRSAFAVSRPDLIVVDDPSRDHTNRWVRLARQHEIPVAAIQDGGPMRPQADLVIDGSVRAGTARRADLLSGPAFAILRPRAGARRPRRASTPRVLIALGGGAHVRRLGRAVASAIVAVVPDVRVDIAAGFIAPRVSSVLPPRCQWIAAPEGLDRLLAAASVAVVAGGVTLYEACANGTPAVAVPVVPAQWPAVAAMAQRGAVLALRAIKSPGDRTPAHIAAAVVRILRTPALAASLGRCGRRTVDGHGTRRVVRELKRLASTAAPERIRHAA